MPCIYTSIWKMYTELSFVERRIWLETRLSCAYEGTYRLTTDTLPPLTLSLSLTHTHTHTHTSTTNTSCTRHMHSCKVNRGNSEYTYKKIVRLHTLLTIIEAFYARGFLTLRTTSSISLIASRLRSWPWGHNILSYAEIT